MMQTNWSMFKTGGPTLQEKSVPTYATHSLLFHLPSMFGGCYAEPEPSCRSALLAFSLPPPDLGWGNIVMRLGKGQHWKPARALNPNHTLWPSFKRNVLSKIWESTVRKCLIHSLQQHSGLSTTGLLMPSGTPLPWIPTTQELVFWSLCLFTKQGKQRER